ncbi:hypothetical protein VMCG_01419 [Cytospora schulzeri]|uniref:Conidiation-specific protein 8 n=1 Tax=Cytospora schulzeri TaxID=448051 RepID=A0A423X6I8_9PEZI|nr:hypothetical protein VMCG_01419 [Valsa malicola]
MDAPKSDRSDSVSSAASSNAAPLSPIRSGRRASGPLFASLQENKRPQDAASIARRQSLNEQRPPPGIIGTMWNNWVRGPSHPT